jgi:hypothetical protein
MEGGGALGGGDEYDDDDFEAAHSEGHGSAEGSGDEREVEDPIESDDEEIGEMVGSVQLLLEGRVFYLECKAETPAIMKELEEVNEVLAQLEQIRQKIPSSTIPDLTAFHTAVLEGKDWSPFRKLMRRHIGGKYFTPIAAFPRDMKAELDKPVNKIWVNRLADVGLAEKSSDVATFKVMTEELIASGQEGTITALLTYAFERFEPRKLSFGAYAYITDGHVRAHQLRLHKHFYGWLKSLFPSWVSLVYLAHLGNKRRINAANGQEKAKSKKTAKGKTAAV